MVRTIFPSLIVAAGILGGTAAARALDGSGAWALTGPALVGLSFVLAALAAKTLGETRRLLGVSAALAGIVMVAGAIVVLADPQKGPSVVPLLGVCGLPLLMGNRACCVPSEAPRSPAG